MLACALAKSSIRNGTILCLFKVRVMLEPPLGTCGVAGVSATLSTALKRPGYGTVIDLPRQPTSPKLTSFAVRLASTIWARSTSSARGVQYCKNPTAFAEGLDYTIRPQTGQLGV